MNKHFRLKDRLILAPVLALPDFSKPFILACDASRSAIGYMLTQRDEMRERERERERESSSI